MEHYFYGIVEDRQDPLMIGRVRVRIHGIHTDNKQLIATPDLPWCQVILPTTAAGWTFGYRNSTWTCRRFYSIWIFQRWGFKSKTLSY